MENNNDFFWQSVAMSDIGAIRKLNEDSVLACNDMGLWAVADGMGGHHYGDMASQLVTTMLADLTLQGELENREEQVIDTLERAHKVLQKEAKEKNVNIIGTTVALLIVYKQKASCIWVGDSRIYVSRFGDLRQLSTDHTQVNEWISQGLLNTEEASKHPAAHILSRAVGSDSQLEPEIVRFPVQVEDIFLICSDGLTAMLSESEIATGLGRWSTKRACTHLMATALNRQAKDNVSLVVVSADESS